MAKAKKPQERKAEIIEAATECFSDKGYHSTGVSDIIARAGIARGTFYLYFQSKNEIFQSILDEFTLLLAKQVKTIELCGNKSPAAQMRENVARIVDVVTSRPALSKIIFNEAVGLDEATQDRLRLFYKRLLDIIQSSIRRGVSFGIVRDVDERVASCVILGSIREVVVQNTVFGNTRIGRKAMIDGLLDVIVGGLGASPML
jgi:AcrR family transcriptional regulator